ncbi:MAG: STAS domain-containing protein [Eubacterium sp.]|nr:STAS domain-containing protein [Eubacterium sp.]
MRTVKEDGLVIMDESSHEVLSICEILKDQEMTLKLSGSITMQVSHEFEDELTSVLTVCSRVVIDFSDVTGISSIGLKALLHAQKILDQRKSSYLRLRKLNSEVLEVFKSLGFEELFEIQN